MVKTINKFWKFYINLIFYFFSEFFSNEKFRKKLEKIVNNKKKTFKFRIFFRGTKNL